MNDVTTDQMQTLLALARMDPFVRQLESFYRVAWEPDMPVNADTDPALCLSVVIMQGAEAHGFPFDMDIMAEVIRESWAES